MFKKSLPFILILVVGFFLGSLFSSNIGNDRYTMDNCAITFDDDGRKISKNGWAFWFIPQDLTGDLNLKMSWVKPHLAHHGAHEHEAGEIFYVLEGTVEFSLRDETKIVGANTALYCPPNVPHGIRNVGDTPIRYLVIKN